MSHSRKENDDFDQQDEEQVVPEQQEIIDSGVNLDYIKNSAYVKPLAYGKSENAQSDDSEGDDPEDDEPEQRDKKNKKRKNRPQKSEAEKLSDLLESYKEDPDSAVDDVKKLIVDHERWEENHELDHAWNDFVVKMVKAAYENKDKALYKRLITHAVALDDRTAETNVDDKRLFLSIVESCTAAADLEDFMLYYENIKTQNALRNGFKDLAIAHILATKDGSLFAIRLFEKLSKTNKKVCFDYLDELFFDDDIAENVLNQEFFKGARGKNFIKEVSNFVKKNKFDDKDKFDNLEDGPVWANWKAVTGAWKKRKRRRIKIIIIVLLCIIIAAAAAFAGLAFWYNSMDASTIAIEGKGVVYAVYGESPDLSAYTITYNKNSGEQVTEAVTEDMLSGYDPNVVGEQTVTIQYKDTNITITIIVQSSQLDSPVLSVSGSTLSWGAVEHASGYYIYISNSQTAAADTYYKYVTTYSYDLSTASDLSGTFYAYVIAKSESSKYSDSARSESVALSKLATVDSVSYSNGAITWSAVSGADHYMINYNGTEYSSITTNSYSVNLVEGPNTIIVHAYSSEDGVIESVSGTLTVTKLYAVTDLSYDGSTVEWSGSGDCYKISIDGADYVSGATYSNSYDVSGWSAGVHSISVINESIGIGTVDSEAATGYFVAGMEISVTSSGTISWDSLSGSNYAYTVYIDGEIVRGMERISITQFTLSSTDVVAGSHTLIITAVSTSITANSKALTFTKLATPTVSLQNNQTVSVSGSYNLLQLDGTTYSDPDSLTAAITAGDHTITVQNVSSENYVLSSDPYNFEVTKLSAPAIYISGGAIASDSDETLSYVVDGSSTSGDLSTLSSGEHTIKAKAKASKSNQLDSEYSNELTVTKLAVPEISYENDTKTLTVSNQGSYSVQYYLDGEEWGGTVSTLAYGSYTVTARFIGNDSESVLSSELSSSLTIFVSDIKVTLTKSDSTHIGVEITSSISGLEYSCTIEYYDADGNSVWDTFTYSYGKTETYFTVNTRSAYRIVVTIYPVDGSDDGMERAEISGLTSTS